MTNELLEPPSDYFDDAQRPDWGAAVNSSTFKPGLRLLPPQIRPDATRLYHVLRVLDDLVDEHGPQASSRIGAVEAWCRDGTVNGPEAEVFADLATRYDLGSDPVAQFCRGMRRDLASTPIETEAELDLYCRQVGGGVGIMLAQVLGAFYETLHLPYSQHIHAPLKVSVPLRSLTSTPGAVY